MSSVDSYEKMSMPDPQVRSSDTTLFAIVVITIIVLVIIEFAVGDSMWFSLIKTGM